MSYQPTTPHIYQAGMILAAKENPSLKLVILRYYQRIYYCGIVDEPDHKPFAYYERELMTPVQ